jgi:L-alanine-DL-glutamate epimerase-like enolase superfamily enzyme
VRWFEEPVSSDDLDGLAFVRGRLPPPMEVAAGEYGYDSAYFARMIAAGAVDVLQADATRCGGVTGFLRVAAQCEARGLKLSAHCAPSLHTHIGCAAPQLIHVEYFYDHQRIERALLRGAVVAKDGVLRPDRGQPGTGLALDRDAAARYQIFDERTSARRRA